MIRLKGVVSLSFSQFMREGSSTNKYGIHGFPFSSLNLVRIKASLCSVQVLSSEYLPFGMHERLLSRSNLMNLFNDTIRDFNLVFSISLIKLSHRSFEIHERFVLVSSCPDHDTKSMTGSQVRAEGTLPTNQPGLAVRVIIINRV